ncbi:hypothetical protein BLNAU_1875 [Blattamonas nauphoetae]|uniref:SEA domain-containing protein n=1 Tax=Blattamonas nauphoetae TaxID=2049346 RepID=A0ABQ9YHV3_9EUKA|nr:hypothetical protein BLNAU_1875 [Blattamonas nauphoetae]
MHLMNPSVDLKTFSLPQYGGKDDSFEQFIASSISIPDHEELIFRRNPVDLVIEFIINVLRDMNETVDRHVSILDSINTAFTIIADARNPQDATSRTPLIWTFSGTHPFSPSDPTNPDPPTHCDNDDNQSLTTSSEKTPPLTRHQSIVEHELETEKTTKSSSPGIIEQNDVLQGRDEDKMLKAIRNSVSDSKSLNVPQPGTTPPEPLLEETIETLHEDESLDDRLKGGAGGDTDSETEQPQSETDGEEQAIAVEDQANPEQQPSETDRKEQTIAVEDQANSEQEKEEKDKDSPADKSHNDSDEEKSINEENKDEGENDPTHSEEGPKEDEPKPEEDPKEDEPKSEEGPKEDEPKPEEGPKEDEPKPEEGPKEDEPKPEEGPKEDEPKPEEGPKEDEPTPEEGPKEDEPKPEEVATDTLTETVEKHEDEVAKPPVEEKTEEAVHEVSPITTPNNDDVNTEHEEEDKEDVLVKDDVENKGNEEEIGEERTTADENLQNATEQEEKEDELPKQKEQSEGEQKDEEEKSHDIHVESNEVDEENEMIENAKLNQEQLIPEDKSIQNEEERKDQEGTSNQDEVKPSPRVFVPQQQKLVRTTSSLPIEKKETIRNRSATEYTNDADHPITFHKRQEQHNTDGETGSIHSSSTYSDLSSITSIRSTPICPVYTFTFFPSTHSVMLSQLSDLTGGRSYHIQSRKQFMDALMDAMFRRANGVMKNLKITMSTNLKGTTTEIPIDCCLNRIVFSDEDEEDSNEEDNDIVEEENISTERSSHHSSNTDSSVDDNSSLVRSVISEFEPRKKRSSDFGLKNGRKRAMTERGRSSPNDRPFIANGPIPVEPRFLKKQNESQAKDVDTEIQKTEPEKTKTQQKQRSRAATTVTKGQVDASTAFSLGTGPRKPKTQDNEASSNDEDQKHRPLIPAQRKRANTSTSKIKIDPNNSFLTQNPRKSEEKKPKTRTGDETLSGYSEADDEEDENKENNEESEHSIVLDQGKTNDETLENQSESETDSKHDSDIEDKPDTDPKDQHDIASSHHGDSEYEDEPIDPHVITISSVHSGLRLRFVWKIGTLDEIKTIHSELLEQRKLEKLRREEEQRRIDHISSSDSSSDVYSESDSHKSSNKPEIQKVQPKIPSPSKLNKEEKDDETDSTDISDENDNEEDSDDNNRVASTPVVSPLETPITSKKLKRVNSARQDRQSIIEEQRQRASTTVVKGSSAPDFVWKQKQTVADPHSAPVGDKTGKKSPNTSILPTPSSPSSSTPSSIKIPSVTLTADITPASEDPFRTPVISRQNSARQHPLSRCETRRSSGQSDDDDSSADLDQQNAVSGDENIISSDDKSEQSKPSSDKNKELHKTIRLPDPKNPDETDSNAPLPNEVDTDDLLIEVTIKLEFEDVLNGNEPTTISQTCVLNLSAPNSLDDKSLFHADVKKMIEMHETARSILCDYVGEGMGLQQRERYQMYLNEFWNLKNGIGFFDVQHPIEYQKEKNDWEQTPQMTSRSNQSSMKDGKSRNEVVSPPLGTPPRSKSPPSILPTRRSNKIDSSDDSSLDSEQLSQNEIQKELSKQEDTLTTDSPVSFTLSNLESSISLSSQPTLSPIEDDGLTMLSLSSSDFSYHTLHRSTQNLAKTIKIERMLLSEYFLMRMMELGFVCFGASWYEDDPEWHLREVDRARISMVYEDSVGVLDRKEQEQKKEEERRKICEAQKEEERERLARQKALEEDELRKNQQFKLNQDEPLHVVVTENEEDDPEDLKQDAEPKPVKTKDPRPLASGFKQHSWEPSPIPSRSTFARHPCVNITTIIIIALVIVVLGLSAWMGFALLFFGNAQSARSGLTAHKSYRVSPTFKSTDDIGQVLFSVGSKRRTAKSNQLGCSQWKNGHDDQPDWCLANSTIHSSNSPPQSPRIHVTTTTTPTTEEHFVVREEEVVVFEANFGNMSVSTVVGHEDAGNVVTVDSTLSISDGISTTRIEGAELTTSTVDDGETYFTVTSPIIMTELSGIVIPGLNNTVVYHYPQLHTIASPIATQTLIVKNFTKWNMQLSVSQEYLSSADYLSQYLSFHTIQKGENSMFEKLGSSIPSFTITSSFDADLDILTLNFDYAGHATNGAMTTLSLTANLPVQPSQIELS